MGTIYFLEAVDFSLSSSKLEFLSKGMVFHIVVRWIWGDGWSVVDYKRLSTND
jgi:hypothetical protein